MWSMATRRRSRRDEEARRQLAHAMAEAGAKVRTARKRRKWSQAQLASRADVSQSAISRLELGHGATLSILVWRRVALALQLPLEFALGRDALEPATDAGHLQVQELMMRLGRKLGVQRMFELPTRPADPARSTDVGWRDDAHRRLIQIECVNSLGSINAALRSTDRKRSEAEALAVAVGHGRPYSVRVCWVVRATRRNRELLATYPEIFASRFRGSSRAWLRALTEGFRPPDQPGLVWCSVDASRLLEWRPRRIAGAGSAA
ncbi:MAG TPA: helix-turn-helix transcriptional regulator [Candidatus Limnocylindria bacterium]|nr:helix-turn-helix transcriptional regulator [Candidatus Limnocylindria bacterium]